MGIVNNSKWIYWNEILQQVNSSLHLWKWLIRTVMNLFEIVLETLAQSEFIPLLIKWLSKAIFGSFGVVFEDLPKEWIHIILDNFF
jgi:hypothetical protein